MRLVSVSFENYRSFVDPTTVAIRPLTLLFGYNSAGKSAVIRLLPLIASSVGSPAGTALALDSDAARGASFRDLLSRLSASPSLDIGLQWRGPEDSALEVWAQVRDLPDRQVQILNRLMVRTLNMGATTTAEALWDTHNTRPGAPSQRYEFRVADGPPEVEKMSVSGMSFDVPPGRPFTPPIQQASTELAAMAESTYWLNSLRTIPERSSRFGTPPGRLASDGRNAADILAHDALDGGELLNLVSKWFRRATGHNLDLKRYAVGAEQHYSLITTPPQATLPIEIPIVDTGEGMAQVLPVIALGCLASLGRLGINPLLAIEHPELHLHPAAHSEVARLLCELVSAPAAPTVVVETHSENILLRVQLAIADGTLRPNDVVVHWVRGLEDGRSVTDMITFDEAARPTGWPPGVFAEDTDQARLLLRLRRQRGLT